MWRVQILMYIAKFDKGPQSLARRGDLLTFQSDIPEDLKENFIPNLISISNKGGSIHF
jgi:hypothetical protein